MATKQDILDMISRLPDSVNSFGALNNDEFFRQMVAFIDTKKDDVVEVPKWLTYKALLTQSGEDAPVARVLNQDEADYIPDITFIVDGIGSFFTDYFAGIGNLVTVMTGNSDSGIIQSFINSDGFIYIKSFDSEFVPSNNVIKNTPIEIKVRQRGAPPKLLSAETNTAGDKVILTFDKKMNMLPANDINNGGGQYNGFAIAGSYLGGLLGSGNQKDNVIESMCDPILNGEIITIYYNPASLGDPGNSVESLDFGLLQPFENFPVVNNVVAPE